MAAENRKSPDDVLQDLAFARQGIWLTLSHLNQMGRADLTAPLARAMEELAAFDEWSLLNPPSRAARN